MPLSTYLPLALGGAGILLLTSSRARRRRTTSTVPADAAPAHQFVDLDEGPEPDPCLGEAYTRNPQPLLAEAYAGVKESARALYGESSVFYLPPTIQGEAFVMLASIRVNEPNVEPVIRTAQQLAPACDWLDPKEKWSPAMMAFYGSLEKMLQIIDKDMEGSLPPRAHAWDTMILLRDGKRLRFEESGFFNFELPSEDATLSITVSPPGSAGVVVTGKHQQVMITEGDQMVERPAAMLWVRLADGYGGSSMQLIATSKSGVTSGTVVIA